MKRTLMTLALVLAAFLALGVSYDRRDVPRFPVARVECTQVSWATGAGHAAKTTTAALNGIVYRIDILISSVTDNPTVDVSFADQNSVVPVAAFSSLADGTNHFENALVNSITTSADFDPVAVAGDVTVTVDPSADPGGSSQTLTVDIIFYVR